MKNIFLSLTSVVLIFTGSLFAQDSVDVTFYYKPTDNPSIVYVPGEFNNWGPNSGGTISPGPGAASVMTIDPSTGIWSRTYWLQVGGPPQANSGAAGEVPGAYQYKFNENGSTWLPDPLNPYQNSQNNSNSILYIKSPTICHFLPNVTSGIVYSQQPLISAYVFPSAKYGVDTSSFVLDVDAESFKIPGTAYNPSTKQLSFLSPIILQNGIRNLKLSVKNLHGDLVSDSTSVTVQAGSIQILNQGGYVTLKTGITIYGSLEDTSIHNVEVIQNGADTTAVQATGGSFSLNASYQPGLNTFVAIAKTAADSTITSTPFTMTYFVNHSPNAVISFSESGNNIILSAKQSTDPDSTQTPALKFDWGVDSANPSAIAGVQGSNLPSITISQPTIPGEYIFSLVATDSSGYSDTTRSYFTIYSNDSVSFSTYASNPEWAKMGRIYELFFKSFTSQGTIDAAIPKLQYIHDMGFNIIWVMPVMQNNQPIDNGTNTGYNIINFYKVAPEYGTNADFKDFVDAAHALGMKVILDVTPNHTSFNNPMAVNAREYGKYSFYWDFYQHHLITNLNYEPNLPEEETSDKFIYYNGYSDQLLNYNWADPDARAYMDSVYAWWVQNMGVDGYRFDSYWGPHDRANNGNGGENEMGTPTRTLLKHVNPDIFLLGETAGTGLGTQVDYADDGGGLDAAYDWNLYWNAIYNFNFGTSSSISNLNKYVTNFGIDTMGYVPGPNALFMRFMENHDQERIAYQYGSYQKTMPMATVVFTVPGIPEMYSGQEVGFGPGISNQLERERGVIDWNSPGKALLTPHYEKLAWIRGTFPAFSTQQFNRLTVGNPWVYAYTRPYPDQNGIALENFSDTTASVSIALTSNGSSANVVFPGGVVNGKTYYLNDVYDDTTTSIVFSGGAAGFSATLPPYGSAVYVLSDSLIKMTYPVITAIRTGSSAPLPIHYALSQNYPNPFNPTTFIDYRLPANSFVTLKVYDVLGREVKTLVSSTEYAGDHEVVFDGNDLASGVYFYRLSARGIQSSGSFVAVNKMLLLK